MNVSDLIADFGYLGIFIIIFIESGLFVGLFLHLPGDTLLLAVGALAAGKVLDIRIVLVVMIVAAIAGDTVGYFTGRKAGPAILRRPHPKLKFLQPENIEKAEKFFYKHGAKSVVIARFLPVVRAAAPILAGIAKMDYRKFIIFNIIGATLWVCLLTFIGYYLGSRIPHLEKYILWVSIAGIFISISVPIIWKYVRFRRKQVSGSEPQ